MRFLRKFLFILPCLFVMCEAKGDLHDTYKFLLEDSIWVVPPSTLPAYQYALGTATLVSDQTVWVIQTYDRGYFFGDTYAGLNGTSTLSHMKMIGTITNEGKIYITFYPIGSAVAVSDLINGIGSFQKEQGAYRFTMQMNSGNDVQGVSHWSYMVRAEEGSEYYNHLPGTGMSLPEFLSLFSE